MYSLIKNIWTDLMKKELQILNRVRNSKSASVMEI